MCVCVCACVCVSYVYVDVSLEQEIEGDALKSSWSRDFFAKNVTEVCACVSL